jgi:exosortase
MLAISKIRAGRIVLWIGLAATLFVAYSGFLAKLLGIWISGTEFSYGLLVPVISGYLVWARRAQLAAAPKSHSTAMLIFVLAGSGLAILASFNGSMLIFAAAFVLSLAGIVGFVWGPERLKVVALPLGFLILMVPIPSYVTGTIAWNLQLAASSFSSTLLEFLGVPVYQDGVLLRLPNHVMEVKEACSGIRSILALLALSLIIGLITESKLKTRVALIIMTPVVAVIANVFRIVCTGFIGWRLGGFALLESWHTALGLLVFIATLSAILGLQKVLRWATNRYA